VAPRWRICCDYLETREVIRKRLAGDALKGRARQFALNRHDLLQERIRDLLQRILPFERPRLSSIEMSGDQLNPTAITDPRGLTARKASQYASRRATA
jgi:hypothetical protein